MTVKGNVFDIQRFCVHDGPGIRTTVFLKGCPLRCPWCHNPESHEGGASIAFYKEKCTSCGACASACTCGCHKITDRHSFDRDECVRACPFGALELFGEMRDADVVLSEVLRDRAFYESSGGGMTVSGGEPLMQPAFLVELLRKAKEEGLHTCIETSGFASEDTVREVARYTDLFLFDIKVTDDARHEALTGVPFSPIKRNLFLLDSLGKSIVLRCPLIPDVNTDDAHIDGVARIAASLKGLIEVNVMAYHTLGGGKHEALGTENKMAEAQAMTEDEKKRYIAAISEAIARYTDKKIRVL